jgi:hypothetical protein
MDLHLNDLTRRLDRLHGLLQARSAARRHDALIAAAVGALAIGAVAIGALAIGRLVIGRARIRALRVDELRVGRLRIDEPPAEPLRLAHRTGDSVPATPPD